ncbi:TauD/TfdA family dioxygenase [Streptomyces sp. S1]|uniref:TauD/TfdA family dioxygenase n=1 Tax=Streptomyces sp. S1 TaxID=718288 RepID=UPI003D708A13
MTELASADRSIIDLPKELKDDLIQIGSALPAWSVEDTFLAEPTIVEYRDKLRAAHLFDDFRSSLLSTLNDPTTGYAVVRLGDIVRELGSGEDFLRLATAILTEIATPFQPFQRWPLWKELGTNLNANPGMSTGTGYNAFHMDVVNSTFPPDYSTLLCVRPDPLGAGASILSNARAAVSRLSLSSRDLLADVAYRYGSFFDLANVGKEYSPFPILDGEPDNRGFVRFTAKMLAESELDEKHAQAARELAEELVAGQVSYRLLRGDILIVNQHFAVHGREPLAEGQHDVVPEDRRLLLQLFLRDRTTIGSSAS